MALTLVTTGILSLYLILHAAIDIFQYRAKSNDS